jgi:hypothetical protein
VEAERRPICSTPKPISTTRGRVTATCFGVRARASWRTAWPKAAAPSAVFSWRGAETSEIHANRQRRRLPRSPALRKGGAPVGGRGSCPPTRYQPRDKVRVSRRGSYSAQICRILSTPSV